MPTWDDVVAIATRLPEVEVTTSWQTPSLKVKGKFFADPWGNLYDLFGGVYLATATPGQFQGMNNVVYNYDGTNLWDQNNQFWFNMYLNVGLADGRLFSLAANRQLGRWY